MQIDNHYSLSFDAHCVTLSYEKQGEINEETGKPVVSRRQTYHGSVKQALKAYVQENLKGAHSINEVLKRIDELKKRIDAMPIKSRFELSNQPQGANEQP